MIEITEMCETQIGNLLGTGYQAFVSRSGITGLAKVEPAHIEVLAVHALIPGTGQFRDFIAGLKKEFPVISVYEIWNEQVSAALTRYGFKPVSFVTTWGEPVTGMRWQA